MNEYGQIVSAIHDIIEELGDVEILSPATIAQRLQDRFEIGSADPLIVYGAREHFKQMSRKELGRAYDKPAEAAVEQAEMFSEKLQPRYPVPSKAGEDRTYVRLEAMTSEQRRWNADRLLKAGRAFTLHGKALLAYDDAHSSTPANDDGQRPEQGAA